MKDAFMDFDSNMQNGRSLIIEMQANGHVMFDDESLLYASYIFSNQFGNEIIHGNDWFKEMKPVYAIQLLDYDKIIVKSFTVVSGEDDLDRTFGGS
jgi:hypothetical protein